MIDAGRALTAHARVIVAAASTEEERAITTWIREHGRWEIAHTARDGESALREALRLRPELVIATVNLPGMTGLEIAEQLVIKAPLTGCVLIADPSSWNAQRRAMHAGALDFLHPPLGEEQAESLEAALRQVLRRRQLHRESGGDMATPSVGSARGSVIRVVSAKGGVGRSLVAANVSAVLARRYPTVLCELDMVFGDLATWGPDSRPKRTMEHLTSVLAARELTPDHIRDVAVTRFGAVTLLPAPRPLDQDGTWPMPLPGNDTRSGDYTQLLAALRRWYRRIVVDHAAGELPDQEPQTVTLVVVTTCEIGALRATQRFLDLAKNRGWSDGVLVVANRASSREARELASSALPRARITYLEEDREFARVLVIKGLAVTDQPKGKLSRSLTGLATTIDETALRQEGT